MTADSARPAWQLAFFGCGFRRPETLLILPVLGQREIGFGSLAESWLDTASTETARLLHGEGHTPKEAAQRPSVSASSLTQDTESMRRPTSLDGHYMSERGAG